MKKIAKILSAAALFSLIFSCQKDMEEEVKPVDTKEKTVSVSGVSITAPETNVLKVGESLQLQAVVVPDDATDKRVIWTSGKSAVATVDSYGNVNALAAGEVTIYAQTEDGGFIARCTFTVEEEKEEPEPENPDHPENPDGPDTPKERWTDTGADVPVYPTYNVTNVKSQSDFPLVEITTSTGRPPASKEYYEDGTVRFADPAKMYSEVTEIPTMEMQIRGRGNSTWEGQYGSKNPYRIKLSAHTAVFGMKGDKDWILLSDRLDNTMIRTAVALRISRLVSMPWTPKYRMVRMTLNGEDKGLYYLVEQKEVDRDNKIPVTVQPGVVDSGYLLELDNKSDNDDYFYSTQFNKKVKYKDPDPYDDDVAKRMTSAQKSYITDYFNSVEKAMVDKDWDKVHSLIEMDSWIQNYLVHEITMNKDGNMRLSTYFAKDSDTKLFMPMVWDFDRAMGQDSYQQTEFALPQFWPYGWFVRIRGGYPNGEDTDWTYNRSYGKRPSYYQYLFEDPAFVARLKELWELYKPRLDNIPAFMEKMIEYNSVMYSDNKKSRIRNMEEEYKTRIEWLDGQIRSLKAQTYNYSKGDFE